MNKKLISIGVIGVFAAAIGFGFHKLSNEKTIKADLSSAIKYCSTGDYKNSILAYEKVLKIDKKNPDAYLGIIRTYTLKGDSAKAQETVNNALKVIPKNPKVLVASAFYSAENNKLDEAIVNYKKALEIDPANSSALSGLYSSYIKKGDKESADKLIADTSKNASALTPFVVNSLAKTKDWDKAFSLLSDTYKKDKDDIAIYDAISSFNNSDKTFISTLKKKMTDNQSNFMYKLLYINLCNNKDFVDEGLTIANSLENELKNSQAYKIALARLYDAKGDTDKAKKLYEDLEKTYPNDYRILHNFGWYYYNNKEYDKAVEYGLKSMASNPEYRDNYAYLIPYSLLKQKKYADEIPYLTTALNLDPTNAQTIYDIGYAYFKGKNYEKALAYFNQSLALQPENANYKYELSICYDKLGNHDKALELADELLTKFPTNDDYIFLKGTINVFMKNDDKALKLFESVSDGYKNSYEYLNNIACLKYCMSDNTDENKVSATGLLAQAKQLATDSQLNDVIQNIDKNISIINDNTDENLWYYY